MATTNHNLQDEWETKSLTELVYFQEGPGLRKYQFSENNEGIPFLNIRTFVDGFIDKSKCQRVKNSEFNNKYEHFLLNEGDLVVSSSGSIGKVAIIRKTDLPVMLNTSVIRFRSKDEKKLTQHFLRYFLQSYGFYSQIDAAKTGSAIFNYGPSHLKEMTIPVPPIELQYKISKQLDSLFPQVIEAQDKITKSKLLVQKFRQAVLSAAVTGKLTEEWREKNHKSDKHPSINPEFDPVDYPSDFPDLPDTWVWTTLSSITDIKGGVTKGRDLTGSKTIKLPYLRVANVQDGYLDLNEIKQIEIRGTEADKYLLKPGDILYTEGGDRDKLGRGTIWNGEIDNCIHQNHIFRARPINGVVSEYISIATKSQIARLYFFNNASQTVNLASINSSTLKKTPIALPPHSEQVEIVSRVKTFYELANQAEKQIENAEANVENLTHSILAKAFRGELIN